jgi:hypothetical protein
VCARETTHVGECTCHLDWLFVCWTPGHSNGLICTQFYIYFVNLTLINILNLSQVNAFEFDDKGRYTLDVR